MKSIKVAPMLTALLLLTAANCEDTGDDDASTLPGDDDTTPPGDDDTTPPETGLTPTPEPGTPTPSPTPAQTLGVLVHESETFEGYTLFPPLRYRETYLIDSDGRVVRSWSSQFTPGQSAYLLETGELLRPAYVGDGVNPRFHGGGSAGRIERFSWDGALVWEFTISSDMFFSHHDVAPLPNGNVLVLVWEYKTQEEAIEAGRRPDMVSDEGLWPDHVIEVKPEGPAGGQVVWHWHVWDHLIQDYDETKANYGVVEDHPELIDINYVLQPRTPDWNHCNGIDYNPELDQIIISSRTFSEFWIIDHSTTVEEARGHSGGRYGHGGDLLYRWGNPRTYRAGDESDQQLFYQHDAQWIDEGLPGAGHILVFNNGADRPDGEYSTVDEIEPPILEDGTYDYTPGTAYGPEAPTWRYVADPPESFYAANISGAQRLPNGNTLICQGPVGTFWEVTSEGEVVWKYVSPVIDTGPLAQGEEVPEGPEGTAQGQMMNAVFKIHRYGPDYPGLAGKDLTPGDTLE